MLKLHGCRKLKLKLVIGNLEENHISMDFSSLLSRTVPVIEEGPCEQRNQLFTVLGSLTDPEEEESKDSSEVNSMRSLAVIASMRRVPSTVLSHIATLPSSWFKAFTPFYVSWESVRTGGDGGLGGVGAGAGGRVIGVSARGGEAGGGEGDAGGGEAGASDGGLCGGCGGGATGLITGATFGAGGGETVGVTAGGGVIGDAGGGVAETGGTTVVGNGWNNCY
ncbi:hypothetical protein HID58_041940 [Brassica napus]|uniref:Uncharacterized protein n=1 Tax=Brassica napus TaxID=3708 RepID=A0ABQ8BDA3_BRANA|nr:hypothetical protein HID58_041940 [Brassica napus]